MKAIFDESRGINWTATMEPYGEVLQQFEKKMREEKNPKIQTATDVLAERLIMCATLSMQPTPRPDYNQFRAILQKLGGSVKEGTVQETQLALDSIKENDLHVMRDRVISSALESVPYLITNDFVGLVKEHDKKIPNHWIDVDTLMQHQHIWITYDADREAGNGLALLAAVVDKIGKKLAFSFWVKDEQLDKLNIGYDVLDMQDKMYDDLEEAHRQTVALLYLLNERLIKNSIVKKKLPRSVRRRSKALAHQDITDEVHFIDLRAFESKGGEGKGETKYDKWRWLVRGHWRKQWLPSTRTHKLMWINEHEKGPEQAPLKERAYRGCR